MSEISEASLQRKLQLVVQTGLHLSRIRDLNTLIQTATDAGLQLCGAQFGAFFYNVTDAAGESYLLYGLSGVDREKFAQFPMPRNTAVFAQTFGGIGVVRSDDITKDPRYGHSAPYFGMPKGHLPVCSYLAVPVMSRTGEVFGGLFYGHAEPGVFDQESEDLIATIASQASVAIENTRLQEQLTRKIADLESTEQTRLTSSRRLAELAAIVESADDAILSKDLNGTIVSWNQAAMKLFGYAPDEIVGSSIFRLIPPHLQSEEAGIIARIRTGERIEHFETIRLTKTGDLIDVSLTISPVRDETGTIVGASKILRDISMKRRLESSLLQAEKIAATGRMAATIAHEINNPLEAIVNLIYLAKMLSKDDAQREYLETAESEVARVSHLAKQSLGFYREHSSAVLAAPATLVTDALRIYEPRCRTANILVHGDIRSSERIVLRRGEMMQVISNLVANAIYAMPNGGDLTISVENTSEPSEGILVSVRDTGVGIPQEQIPRIFEAFYTTRGNIGTGIGLFVARQFVEGHGGTITVQSNTAPENHGTCMTIFLPLHTPYEDNPSA